MGEVKRSLGNQYKIDEKHITNAQQSTTCLFSDLVELNLYFCKIGSIKNS